MRFVKVAAIGDIPEGYGRLLDVEGRVVAVFNRGGGRFHATSPVCPHEDGPLGDGWIEGDAVVCPWHGYDFDLGSGRCLSDPDLAIAVYRVRVTGTTVEIDLG
jgi:nitrite reductase/ring-hydroxylating ferredoxin subunit